MCSHQTHYQPPQACMEERSDISDAAYRLSRTQRFAGGAGNLNAKSNLASSNSKEGINHGYKATEHPDPLGR